MKSFFVNTLVPNENVTAQFLVLNKEIRQKKSGEPYLSLHLADRTGEIEAKMWDNVTEVMNTFERDHFIKVKGLPQVYNNRSQFVIHKLRRLEDHEVDFADYFPCSERNPEEMFVELKQLIGSLGNKHLKNLLELIFADEKTAAQYRVAPAAKSIHHACRGGLLEHVLSLCDLAKLVGQHYSEIDVDLLLTGVVLHDIGKLEELYYERSFGYSADGQLLGHIVLGLRLVDRTIDRLPDFPHKLRTLVEHLIISHHGELEFGSPKVPLFPEAMLLHHLDNLDSKMNAMRAALNKDLMSEGEFTGWIPSLERTLLRKDRFLSEQPPSPLAAPVAESNKSEPAVSEANQEPQHPAVDQLTQASMPFERQEAKRSEEHKPEKATPNRQPMNTLFGDKLQAVLDSRK
jgi:3'-5' exoribonuclease